MSAAVSAKPKAVVMNVRQRTQGWFSAVNLHWAGIALLGLVNLYLLIHMGLAWQTANSDNAAALDAQRNELKAAQIAARPLEGLDVKLRSATESADVFYQQRLPVSYSEFAGELGTLKTRTGVRLTGANYSQAPAVGTSDAAGGQLTEVRIDARLTGAYRGLVEFLNGLERDKHFFLVNGIALTGQQTGLVSLRMRMTTYMRGSIPEEQLQKANTESPLEQADRDAIAAAVKRQAAGGA